ncbi:DUF6268 family outer membrane beta-barrel protein [Hymenobacter sp. 5317J-9]|uniref:DUF6268 family outer membrane beta-barrel protein n=1 Tax=Hymenobacter sp. 5317J-9 TaxID=2932250 RepID=UPI001FD67C1B|nr:DUF6268 family outer membrane beta-barrel protein [Hymenobacter sp. 5317J-9]UOQ99636.1 DUF6268 family outer membrane beta-barrel protein [Hymenobacter sp. 5317J-9]
MKLFARVPLRLLLFALALGLLPTTARSQGYAEGVGLNYEVLPLKLGAAETSFRADIYRANAIVPIALAADSSRGLLLGASLEALRFSGPRPGFAVGNVYGLSPVLGYRHRVSSKLELTALVLPALNSDLRDVRAGDLTWGGVLRAGYRTSPRRAYRLTVGYRQQFYGPQYVLLLGLDWRLGQRWRLFGDLPTTFNVSYAVTPRVNAGFNLNGINTAYRLQEQNRYFQYLQGHYGLFAETYVSARWALRATAAYAVTRRLEVYAQEDQWPATLDYIGLGQAPTPLSPRVEKGLAFRLALSYRVPTP